MPLARVGTCVALLAALLWRVADARAQEWIHFNPVQGEVRLSFDGRWQSSDTGSSSRELETEEAVRLRLNGFSIDPRIFTFDVNLEPVFTQQDSKFFGVDETNDSQFLNYGAAFSFLEGTPVSPFGLAASFSQSSGDLDGNLGARSSFETQDRRASLRWKSRAFPSTLSYIERDLEQDSRASFASTPTRRDELLRTVRYLGRSSKMELLLEANEFDDQTVFDRDYTSEQARLSNFFRWGKGSSLTSRIDYFNRDDFNAYDSFSVDESLTLQHTRNFNTDYGYRFQQTSTDVVETDTQSALVGFTHRLYQNLTTTFRLDGTMVDSSDGFEEDSYGGRLDFVYNKKIRWDGRMRAQLGGGYRTTESTGGLVQVFGETHTIPSVGLNIVTLDNAFVEVATIIVTAPGCNPCAEGAGGDYTVQAAGDFTQLVIDTNTSNINAGDTITVDYDFRPRSASFYGVPYRVGLRFDFSWISIYHSSDGEDQTLREGDPTAVTDRQNDLTGFELRWRRGGSRASFSADRRYFKSDNFESEELIFRQSLFYVFSPGLSGSAGANQTFYVGGDTDGELYSIDGNLTWFPRPGLQVKPRASAYRRTQDPGSEDTFVGAGIDFRWNWRQVTVDVRYDHNYRDSNNNSTEEDRVFMEVKRRF